MGRGIASQHFVTQIRLYKRIFKDKSKKDKNYLYRKSLESSGLNCRYQLQMGVGVIVFLDGENYYLLDPDVKNKCRKCKYLSNYNKFLKELQSHEYFCMQKCSSSGGIDN